MVCQSMPVAQRHSMGLCIMLQGWQCCILHSAKMELRGAFTKHTGRWPCGAHVPEQTSRLTSLNVEPKLKHMAPPPKTKRVLPTTQAACRTATSFALLNSAAVALLHARQRVSYKYESPAQGHATVNAESQPMA